MRTDTRQISETVIYRAGTYIVDQQMFIDEPVVPDVVVIDPLAGLIAGVAEREIDLKTAYDSSPVQCRRRRICEQCLGSQRSRPGVVKSRHGQVP